VATPYGSTVGISEEVRRPRRTNPSRCCFVLVRSTSLSTGLFAKAAVVKSVLVLRYLRAASATSVGAAGDNALSTAAWALTILSTVATLRSPLMTNRGRASAFACVEGLAHVLLGRILFGGTVLRRGGDGRRCGRPRGCLHDRRGDDCGDCDRRDDEHAECRDGSATDAARLPGVAAAPAYRTAVVPPTGGRRVRRAAGCSVRWVS